MKRAFVLLALTCACTGVTEGGLVEFRAVAAGPRDASGGALTFRTRAGFDVILTTAVLHIGALYLNRTVPLTSQRESSCVLPGTYVAQVTGGVDVDLLRAEPVAFPVSGTGLQDRAANGEVWLTGSGDVNATEDNTPVFVFAGVARAGGVALPFRGSFSIGANRVQAPRSAALPGSNPICQERIVTGIPVDLRMTEGGLLTLRADPRAVFADVDFAALAPASDGTREFLDREEGQPSIAAYFALRASKGVYSFGFEE